VKRVVFALIHLQKSAFYKITRKKWGKAAEQGISDKTKTPEQG
jgi:hypothetical protein